MVCFIVSIILLNLSSQGKRVFYDVAIITVLSPIESVLSVKKRYFHVYEENKNLRIQNLLLKNENDQLKQYGLQNSRLKELLAYKSDSGYTLLAGEVIARNPGRYETTWIINLGTNDSLSENMAVLTTKGIVGKTVKVYQDYSMVQILKDATSKVSIRVQRSRVIGILESYKMREVIGRFPSHLDVQDGDTILTSGLGGVFPKGIPVGVVVDKERMNDNVIRRTSIKLFQNPSLVEEVFVIEQKPTWIVEKGEDP